MTCHPYTEFKEVHVVFSDVRVLRDSGPCIVRKSGFLYGAWSESGIDSVIVTPWILDRCPCAIRSRPYELQWGLFCTIGRPNKSPVGAYGSALETMIYCTAFNICFEIHLAPLHPAVSNDAAADATAANTVQVGRCRLTLSNPR